MEDKNWELIWNGFWNFIIIVTTVGYGDLYPVTSLGRCTVVITCCLGPFLISTITYSISNNIDFSEWEYKAFKKLKKNNQLKKLENSASELLSNFFRLNYVNKKGKALDEELKTDFILTVSKFKKERANYFRMRFSTVSFDTMITTYNRNTKIQLKLITDNIEDAIKTFRRKILKLKERDNDISKLLSKSCLQNNVIKEIIANYLESKNISFPPPPMPSNSFLCESKRSLDQESEVSVDTKKSLKRKQSLKSRKSQPGLLNSDSDSSHLTRLRDLYKKTTFLKKGSTLHFFDDSGDIMNKLRERSREQVASVHPLQQAATQGLISKSRSQKLLKSRPDLQELVRKRRSGQSFNSGGRQGSIELKNNNEIKRRESKFALSSRYSKVSQFQVSNDSSKKKSESSRISRN